MSCVWYEIYIQCGFILVLGELKRLNKTGPAISPQNAFLTRNTELALQFPIPVMRLRGAPKRERGCSPAARRIKVLKNTLFRDRRDNSVGIETR